MSHEITKSSYIFSKDYVDSKERNLKITVTLNVDHLSGKFQVIPTNTSRQEFGFISDSSLNNTMWVAVTEAIQEAIAFGNDLVNNKNVEPNAQYDGPKSN